MKLWEEPEDQEPLDIPQLDQSLYYRNPLREFDRGPHDPMKGES